MNRFHIRSQGPHLWNIPIILVLSTESPPNHKVFGMICHCSFPNLPTSKGCSFFLPPEGQASPQLLGLLCVQGKEEKSFRSVADVTGNKPAHLPAVSPVPESEMGLLPLVESASAREQTPCFALLWALSGSCNQAHLEPSFLGLGAQPQAQVGLPPPEHSPCPGQALSNLYAESSWVLALLIESVFPPYLTALLTHQGPSE